MAIHESRIAIEQIERLNYLGQRQRGAIETWRRAYIKACQAAAEAIDALWDEHRWPEDGARDRRFEWRPSVKR
jgi:hypothetical protein